MAEPAGNAAARPPVARSPVRQAPPVEVTRGWEVSVRRVDAPLRLSDASPLAKALVRAPGEAWPGAALGRARRDEGGALVVGSRPGEWTVLGAPEQVWPAAGAAAGPVVDLTHGLALLRLSGAGSDEAMRALCAIDLTDAVTPDGTAFTSSVAKVVAEVVRDDVAGERSYLLLAERSHGQYLFDAVRDAGARLGLEVDGFPGWQGL